MLKSMNIERLTSTSIHELSTKYVWLPQKTRRKLHGIDIWMYTQMYFHDTHFQFYISSLEITMKSIGHFPNCQWENTVFTDNSYD